MEKKFEPWPVSPQSPWTCSLTSLEVRQCVWWDRERYHGNRCHRNARERQHEGPACCAILLLICHKVHPSFICRKIVSWRSQDSSVGTEFGVVQAAALVALKFQNGSVGVGWGECRQEGWNSTNYSSNSCHDWVFNKCQISTGISSASSHLTFLKALEVEVITSTFCGWDSWASEMKWTAHRSLSRLQSRDPNSGLHVSEAPPPKHGPCAWGNPMTHPAPPQFFQQHTMCPFT